MRPTFFSDARGFSITGSFHESGESRISPEVCRNLGLSIELEFDNYGFHSRSWSAYHHKSTRQYQLLRGFDPSTAHFARHLGFDEHIFHPVVAPDRFKEVHDDQDSRHPESHITLSRSNAGTVAQDREVARSLTTISEAPIHQAAVPTLADSDPGVSNERWGSDGAHGLRFAEAYNRSDLSSTHQSNQNVASEDRIRTYVSDVNSESVVGRGYDDSRAFSTVAVSDSDESSPAARKPVVTPFVVPSEVQVYEASSWGLEADVNISSCLLTSSSCPDVDTLCERLGRLTIV
ncbi:hypothetical protein PM082_014858 [Marasmius tenuissimus]|nr:hypothetical protein PM082_014858 [Marasmius tenuissimus]